MMTGRLLALLAFACHAPVEARAVQHDTVGPVAVLHVLTDAEGVAVRGAPTVLGDRLYFPTGERGPDGASQCSSTALWRTVEHTQHCPGSLVSLRRADGGDVRVDHAFTQLDDHYRNSDGYHPYGTLAVGRGRDRRLYGVTQMGGSPTMEAGEVGYGVLFAYSPPGAGDPGSFEVLYTFASQPRAADGEYPMGALAIDAAGNVFGTAKGGGAASTGTVWEWSPGGAFRWSPLPAGAGEVYGGVTLAGGLLHGTTWGPGADAGAYFTADPATLEVRIVARFPGYAANEHGTDNTPIQAPLALRDGTVIAVREFGGPAGTGLIASLDPRIGITPLWSPGDIPLEVSPRFSNATGGMLNGAIAEGRDGQVYGTTQYGGAYGTGGIYRIARDGSLFQLLYSWPDAAYPYGGVAAGDDGALYGVTFGTGQVFRFDPPAGACMGGP